jgi:endonuclease III
MHAVTRRALYRRLQAANPEPTTELEHSSPFELLVAVMLSAHTTDKSVNAATRKLFPAANTPQAIYDLGVEEVKEYLKTVGLYNTKAANLIGLCKQILEKHGGQVPSDRESLEALPGVGRKTASIILNMVFGKMDIAVDTHIFRVANRTGLAPGKNPRAVEDALVANTPDEFKKNAHHWLLLHGRYVCTARKPACPKCVINDLCEYPDKTPAGELASSDAPVAHRQAPPAIADRIEGALEAKAAGRFGRKPRTTSARSEAASAGKRARPGREASAGKTARSGKKAVRAPGRNKRRGIGTQN